MQYRLVALLCVVTCFLLGSFSQGQLQNGESSIQKLRKHIRELGGQIKPDANGLSLDLQAIDLSKENFELFDKSLPINQLNLERSGMTDQHLTYLGSIHSLSILNISSNHITTSGLDKLARLPLRELRLRFNRLSDSAAQPISAIQSLEALDLSYNGFSGKAISMFRRLKSLKELDLSYNQVADLTDFNESLLQIQTLSLAGCPLEDSSIKTIQKCRQLKRFDLSGTKISASAIAELGNHLALESLAIANTNVNDDALRVLNGMPQLKELRISSTRVSDVGLKLIVKCAALESLDLRFTAITDAGMPLIASLSDLKAIHLVPHLSSSIA